MVAERVRWAILGAGGVAARFAAAFDEVEGSELALVAARDLRAAETLARRFGCLASSFEEALESPSIDCVYIALPHALHRPWAIRALDRRKAVLVEKPAGLSAHEVLDLQAAALESGTLLVEAMKPRFQPAWPVLLDRVARGDLGELRAIRATLLMGGGPTSKGYFTDPVQGGTLLDLGPYCANLIEALTQGRPRVLGREMEWDGPIERAASCRLDVGGVACELSVGASGDEALGALEFEGGRIELGPIHRPERISVWRPGEPVEVLEAPIEGSDFAGELAHVSELVRQGATESPVMPLDASVGCARIIDACRSGFDRLGVGAELEGAIGRGSVAFDEPMAAHTTFEVGGPADLLITPEDPARLCRALDILGDVPCVLVGRGSDLLVSDAGLRACVVSSERLDRVEAEPPRLTAEAGVSLRELTEMACALGLSGLEFANGIPGSVGGALYMNAGAYDGCMADVVERVRVRRPDGSEVDLAADELGFGYRQSRIRDEGLCVLKATFRLRPADPEAIRVRMDELWEARVSKQPLDLPSAGSTFKRPEGHFAGKLISDAGLKGARVGGAQVSEKHAGFVVNTGGATARDVHDLIAHVVDVVRETSGVTLEPEVRMLGRF